MTLQDFKKIKNGDKIKILPLFNTYEVVVSLNNKNINLENFKIIQETYFDATTGQPSNVLECYNNNNIFKKMETIYNCKLKIK